MSLRQGSRGVFDRNHQVFDWERMEGTKQRLQRKQTRTRQREVCFGFTRRTRTGDRFDAIDGREMIWHGFIVVMVGKLVTPLLLQCGVCWWRVRFAKPTKDGKLLECKVC